MAWIKLDHFTPDKPEIIQAASILSIDQDAVLGKCIRLWIWADQQSISGDALSVTKTFLDRLVSCNGFSDVLVSVGWLDEKRGVFSFPNFDRHNGESAKKRAQTANRMQKFRNAPSVTFASPDKIREEKSKEPPIPPKSKESENFQTFAEPIKRIFSFNPTSVSDERKLWDWCQDFAAKGTTAEEVETMAKRAAVLWDGKPFTAKGILNNWDSLKNAKPPKQKTMQGALN
jgi:hypothetical protein